MKVKLKDIPKSGLAVDKFVTPEEIGLALDGVRATAPLKVKLHVGRYDDEVEAKGSVAGKYELTCARCLAPVIKERTDPLELYIDVNPSTEFVDLGEEIRQELVLTLSGVALCREDCRGLCASCGVDLNREKCDCKK